MDLGLRVEAVYDDPDLIELMVRAWNGEYGGATGLYVSIGELSETASRLRGFPATLTDRRVVQWGAFGSDTAGGGVEMRFVARSDGGGAIVDVRMESDGAKTGGLQAALVRLELEAAAVDTFAAALRQLDVHKRGVAVLRHGCG
jgi:hypothetical protein